MGDTDALIDASYGHSLNSRKLDRRGKIGRDVFMRFWDVLGENIAEAMHARRGVELPRFATISIVAPVAGHIDPDNPRNHKHSTPTFMLDNKFATAYGSKRLTKSSAQGPNQRIARNHPYSWSGVGITNAMASTHELCFHRMGAQISETKESCRRMYDIVVRCLGTWVANGWDFEAALPFVGTIVHRTATGFHMKFSTELQAEPSSSRPGSGLDILASPAWAESEPRTGRRSHPQPMPTSSDGQRGSRGGREPFKARGRPERLSRALNPPSSRSSSRSSSSDGDKASRMDAVSGNQDHRTPDQEQNLAIEDLAEQYMHTRWWQDLVGHIQAKSEYARKLFRALDKDKSGLLDYKEFSQGLKDIGAALQSDEFEKLLQVPFVWDTLRRRPIFTFFPFH
eukprot:SAG31_NODE_5159_length_2708_cov_3.731315_1_plen_397_part_00